MLGQRENADEHVIAVRDADEQQIVAFFQEGCSRSGVLCCVKWLQSL